MRKAPVLLIGPSVLFLSLFMLAPLALVALMSVYTYSPTNVPSPPLTLANYARITDRFYIDIYLRTMRIGLMVTVATALLAVPCAYTLSRSSLRVKAVGLFLILTPLMVSTVIRVFGWIVILGRNGVVNDMLMLIGAGPYRLIGNEAAVMLGMVQLVLPFMVLPLMASFERVPRNLEEAATSLGAGWYTTFFRIVLPLGMPGLISGAILTYMLSLSALVTPALLGGQRVRMLAEQIYDEILNTFNWPAGSAMSIVLIATTFALLLASFRIAELLRRQRGLSRA